MRFDPLGPVGRPLGYRRRSPEIVRRGCDPSQPLIGLSALVAASDSGGLGWPEGLALGVSVVSAFFAWRSDRRTGRAEDRALDAERRERERHEREQAEAADRRRAHLHLEPMPPPMVDVVGRRTIVEASKHGFQLVDIPITDPIENDSACSRAERTLPIGICRLGSCPIPRRRLSAVRVGLAATATGGPMRHPHCGCRIGQPPFVVKNGSGHRGHPSQEDACPST